MIINKKFCVIGLGYFGQNLALSLSRKGAYVLAIDKDPDRVDLIKEQVEDAVVLDSTDEKTMRNFDIKDMDAAIVAIGEDFESSIITTAILQEIGVKKIINRVLNPIHERILRSFYITDTLVPEAEAADHLANKLIIPELLESYKIYDNYHIYEIKVPDWLIGQTIQAANIRGQYNLNIVTIKTLAPQYGILRFNDKKDYVVVGIPKPDSIFNENDILVLFGQEKDFMKFIGE